MARPLPSARHRRPRVNEAGLFKKHLMGDYSLTRSYWLHTMVLGWGVVLVGGYVFHKIGERYPVRYLSMAVLAFQPLALAVWLWSTLGTWVAAMKRLFSGEGWFWAVVAMASLAFGAVAMLQEMASLKPMLQAHWAVANGQQATSRPFKLTALDGGRVVAFSGGINEGAAKALDQALTDSPQARMVLLDSPGGWLREGERMAEVVRRRQIHTHVDKGCHSSCTLVLLAGPDRTAGEHAAVGFHRGRGIGEQKDDEATPSGVEAALYLRAGLSPAFVKQILATPNDSIWVPTRQQLLAGGVLTR